MLCLNGFELYPRWVTLTEESIHSIVKSEAN